MTIKLRPYRGQSDDRSMIALSHDAFATQFHIADLPYRLSSWSHDNPENVGIWVNDKDEILAWTVIQIPFWSVDIVISPRVETSEIAPLALDWADERALRLNASNQGHAMWFVNVREHCSEMKAALANAGYANQAKAEPNPWSKTVLKRSKLLSIPDFPLLKGVVILPTRGQDEVDAYVNLHQGAFGSNNMSREWRLRTIRHSDYLPELDLAAFDGKGEIVAFCIGWLSNPGMNGECSGQIEPMGVRKDFQRRGLGRAILSETMRRIYSHSVENVYVETDSIRDKTFEFYQSCGFEPCFDVEVWRKDFPVPDF